jgi:hypothetical protein
MKSRSSNSSSQHTKNVLLSVAYGPIVARRSDDELVCARNIGSTIPRIEVDSSEKAQEYQEGIGTIS